jgi:hypothetical protein
MSDFDKIINDRLNEEDGEFFPRREANWDALSQRLAEFDKANPLPTAAPKPVLTAVWRRWAWTSAAAALVGVSGLLFWHFNEVHSLEQQNAGLAKEIVSLKSGQQPANGTTIVERKTTVETNTTIETTKTVVEQSPNASYSKNEVKVPVSTNNRIEKPSFTQKETLAGVEQKQGNAAQNKINAAIVDNKSGSNKRETVLSENAKTAVSQKRNNIQIAKVDNKNMPNALPFDSKNAPLNSQKTFLNEGMAFQKDPSVSSEVLDANRTNIAQNKPIDVPIAPKTGDVNIQSNVPNLDKVETITQTPPAQSNRDVPSVSNPISGKEGETQTVKTGVAAVENTKKDSLANTNIAAQTTETKKDETAPIIKPAPKKNVLKNILPKGIALGIEGFYASESPDVRGIMPTTGKGLTAELAFANNISLTASGDLLETHFDVGERPKHIRVKNEPNPPRPNVALHRIKGEQRSRLLSLGAKYIFGQKWWAQPNVSAGHSWQKIEGYPVNFVFRDIATGEDTAVPVQVETEKIKSLWQLGVGLEKRIKRFTFGVSAEMQKDFSKPTDPNGQPLASNFGILRGGVKFNIF